MAAEEESQTAVGPLAEARPELATRAEGAAWS